MIAQSRSNSAHFSAEVALSLEIDDTTYSLCTVEPDRFVLKDQHFLTATQGTLVITINKESDRTPIRLESVQDDLRTYHYHPL